MIGEIIGFRFIPKLEQILTADPVSSYMVEESTGCKRAMVQKAASKSTI